MKISRVDDRRQQGSLVLYILLALLVIMIGVVGWLVFHEHTVPKLPTTNTPLMINNMSANTFTIDAPSMEPTLKVGDVATITPGNSNVALNNIVAFNTESGQMLIKRVVAMSGDHVIIKNGTLLVINGAHTGGYDPALTYESPGMTTPGNVDLIVPSDTFFVLGDNRTNSLDSRTLGPIRRADIIGKVQQ